MLWCWPAHWEQPGLVSFPRTLPYVDRTTNPMISGQPAVPLANKTDANKIVYIVELLCDEVAS